MKATTWQSKRQYEFQKWLELRTNYSKYRSISSKFHNYVTTEMLFHIPAITVCYFPIHGLYLPPHSDCAPHATAQNTASFSGGPQTKQDVTPGESSIVLKCGWLIVLQVCIACTMCIHSTCPSVWLFIMYIYFVFTTVEAHTVSQESTVKQPTSSTGEYVSMSVFIHGHKSQACQWARLLRLHSEI